MGVFTFFKLYRWYQIAQNISDVLRDLVPFVQFKKCKNTQAAMTLLKSCVFTLLKVILLDDCF